MGLQIRYTYGVYFRSVKNWVLVNADVRRPLKKYSGKDSQ
jgi:hypothetical protein